MTAKTAKITKNNKKSIGKITPLRRNNIIAQWKSGNYNTQKALLASPYGKQLSAMDLSRLLSGIKKGANREIIKAGAEFQAGIQGMPRHELKQVVGEVEFQATTSPLRKKVEQAAASLVKLINSTIKVATKQVHNPDERISMQEVKYAMEALDKALIIINEAPRHASKTVIDSRNQTIIDGSGKTIEKLTKSEICEEVGKLLPN